MATRLRQQQQLRVFALAFAAATVGNPKSIEATTAATPTECHATTPSREMSGTRSSSPSTRSSLFSNNMKLWMYRNWLFPFSYLPVPRLLTSQDPLFSSPRHVRGLKQRQQDEILMHEILTSTEAQVSRYCEPRAPSAAPSSSLICVTLLTNETRMQGRIEITSNSMT